MKVIKLTLNPIRFGGSRLVFVSKKGGEMDIKKLDIDKLKSLAYDEIQKLETAQRNLRAINQEIASRQGRVVKNDEEKPKEEGK